MWSWFKKPKKEDPVFYPPNVDIKMLPSAVLRLTGKVDHPANCWNATQIFFKDEQHKFTSAEDMEVWLSNNTKPDDMNMCAPNSIIVMRQGELLIHTAVYVAPGWLWHKRGCSGHWEFVTPQQLRMIYFEADRFENRLLKS